jgi:hypothetical protein
VRLRWVAVEIFIASALAASIPVATAPPGHAAAPTRLAQASFGFGDSCVVNVTATEVQLRINRFCADGTSSVSAPLGAGDVAFTKDTARVAATAEGWTVNLAWQAAGKAKNVHNKTTGTVVRDSPATITGSVSDGTTTVGPAQLQFADLATLVKGTL